MIAGTFAPSIPMKIAAVAAGLTFAYPQATSSLPGSTFTPSAFFQTNTGLTAIQPKSDVQTQSVVEITKQIKAKSGLTWEELAQALGVTRRTLHNWALGSEIDSQNENRLRRFSEIIRSLGFDQPLQVRQYLRECVTGLPRYLSLLGDSKLQVAVLEPEFVADQSRLQHNWNPKGFSRNEKGQSDIEIPPTHVEGIRKVRPRRVEIG